MIHHGKCYTILSELLIFNNTTLDIENIIYYNSLLQLMFLTGHYSTIESNEAILTDIKVGINNIVGASIIVRTDFK